MDPTILAYIAGFLDGDGSIFFQITRRKDYVFGYQLRCNLAFYQKSDHQEILVWLKGCLKAGYMRHRKTGVSDYTIVDPAEVKRILLMLQPYVRLKKEHVALSLTILERLPICKTAQEFLKLCYEVDRFQTLNYSKKRTNTASVVESHLKANHFLTPVETSSYKEESGSEKGAAKTPISSLAK